jgi:hypothetical protein
VAAIEPLLDNNRLLRAAFDTRIGDLRLWELVAATRREVLSVAAEYTASYRDVERPDDMADWIARPIVMGGHQPTLFHPGVWLKNFVAAAYATRLGGTAINLVVDTDRCGNPSVGVPVASDPRADSDVHLEAIPFDVGGQETAWEERGVLDTDCFRSFGSRACQVIQPFVPEPILRRWWPLVVERAAASHRLGLGIAQARHALEGRLGCDTLELPVSEMMRLPTVMVFTGYLLSRARELHEAYNASLAAYRRRHRQRGVGRPMPDLLCLPADDSGGSWYEVPWWIWSKDDHRRRRVYAHLGPSDTLTLSDLETVRVELPISPGTNPARWVDALSRLEEHEMRLRPRAILTTLFARVLVADLFVHGIGGAAYDQITDDIVRRLTGCDPPRYAVVSGTLRLPAGRGEDPAIERARADGLLRDLAFHPERHLEPLAGQPEEVRRLVERKWQWIDTFPTPALARRRCAEIRSANEALAAFTMPLRERTLAGQASLASRIRGWKVLSSREFSWCFFNEKELKPFLLLENTEKIA